LVSKVVQYVIEELYSSEKFRKLVAELLSQVAFGVPQQVVRQAAAKEEEKDEDFSLESVAEAFGKLAASNKSVISGDISVPEKVVKADGSKDTVNLLMNIGE
jgi:hypothetical protein